MISCVIIKLQISRVYLILEMHQFLIMLVVVRLLIRKFKTWNANICLDFPYPSKQHCLNNGCDKQLRSSVLQTTTQLIDSQVKFV